MDSRGRRDQGRTLREDRQDHGARARRRSTPTGKYVSPGWIDMMDQSGGVLPRNGLAENKLQEGVTTAIGGEGGTPVPAGARRRVLRDAREARGSASTSAATSARRRRASPCSGMSARKPNAAELDRMRAIMDTAMRGGAMGMTTALIYPPSSYCDHRRAGGGREGGGEVRRHVREPHSRRRAGKSSARSTRRSTIGEKAGLPGRGLPSQGRVPAGVGHPDGFRAPGRRRGARARRRRRGGLYVYTAGGTGLEATIPSWAHEGGTDSLKARLANPQIARAAQARSRRPARRVGGTSSRRPAAGTASCSSTRAIRPTRSTSRRRSRRSRASRTRIRPTRRGISSRRAAVA